MCVFSLMALNVIVLKEKRKKKMVIKTIYIL